MRGDMLLFFAFWALVAAGGIALVSAVFARWKQRLDLERRRFELLEKALQQPILDDATRTELLRALAAPRHPTAAAHQGNWWPKLWYGAAWGMFIVGGCLMAAEGTGLTRIRDSEPLVVMTAIGFAALTLPAALRELMRRNDAAPVRR